MSIPLFQKVDHEGIGNSDR